MARKHYFLMRVPAGRSLLWPILCSPCVTFCSSLAFTLPKLLLPAVLCRRGNLGFTKGTASAPLYTTAEGTCSKYVALNLFTNTMLCANFWAPRSHYFTYSCNCKWCVHCLPALCLCSAWGTSWESEWEASTGLTPSGALAGNTPAPSTS